MGKRRIFAFLLSVCMMMESLLTASAEGMEHTDHGNAAEMETLENGEAFPESTETIEESEAEPEDPAETSTETVSEEADSVESTESGTTEAAGEETAETTGETEEIPQEEETNPFAEETMQEGIKETAEESETETMPETVSETKKLPADGAGADEEEETPKVVDFQIEQHFYGCIKLSWKVQKFNQVNIRCNLYRAEQQGGEYTLIAEELYDPFGDTVYDHYEYRDQSVESVENSAANKKYYYKIKLSKYIEDEDDWTQGSYVETGYESETVSNKDWDYYGYPNTEEASDYIGAYLVDQNGNRIDSLALKKGEIKQLNIMWVKKDKTTVPAAKDTQGTWSVYDVFYKGGYDYETDWDVHKVGNDKIDILPVKAETPNANNLSLADYTVYVRAKSNVNVGDQYYLSADIRMHWNNGKEEDRGRWEWQIPIEIIEGETENTETAGGIFSTKEEFCQAVRDEMIKRTSNFTFFVRKSDNDGWWITDESRDETPASWDYEDIFDFYREREGMKPNEGDYLLHARGSATESAFVDEWLTVGDISFNDEYYEQYEFSPHFITTKAQEKQVDDKINEIIHTPGGALYEYRNKSDREKAEAAYQYVIDHVSYKGTTEPIYHTCYSALINGVATCQGYAILYYRLTRELGVPNRVLMGVDANAHTYNIVKLSDEGDKWYYVDTNGRQFLKGEKEFNHAQLQAQYLTDSFKREYLSKIPGSSYGTDLGSALKEVTSLNDDSIIQLNPAFLHGIASRMSAKKYTLSGNKIKAEGTIKYVTGCSGYLGYEQGAPVSGYFLALKLKAGRVFTQEGYIKVSFTKRDGQQAEQVYKIGDSTLKNGYVNLILDVTEYSSDIKVTVDFDTDDESRSVFPARVYSLDLSALKKEAIEKSTGGIKEISKELYGTESSSPVITRSKDGTQIDAVYEAVAYSTGVILPYGMLLPDGTSLTDEIKLPDGNYVTLQLNMPEAIKYTAMEPGEQITVEKIDSKGENEQEPDWYWQEAYDEDENVSCVRIVIPLTFGDSKKFAVNWGNGIYAWKQTVTVATSKDCIMESRNENAILPGSIAFNGLATTMYIGQTQNIHTTIKKKYELDTIQLFYTSSASDIVSVNRVTGELKALKEGTATIKVSAVNKAGQSIEKTAKITVKKLTAPANVKVSEIKDNSAVISWKANTTGQYAEVYAVPLDTEKMGSKKAAWKSYIENALKAAGMEDSLLVSLTGQEKTIMLKSLADTIGTGECLAESAQMGSTRLKIEGLEKEKTYVFYIRNISQSAASTVVFNGVTSDKFITKSTIFDSIRLKVCLRSNEQIMPSVSENGIPVYIITEADLTNDSKAPGYLSYEFLDKDQNVITDELKFTSVKFTTNNKNAVNIHAAKGSLTYGAQAGDALIQISGKDASGTVRKSEPVIIRLIRKPTALKAKTTTITIGQSISIKELVGVNLKGSAEMMDMNAVDFDAALEAIKNSGYFVVTYKEESAPDADHKYPAEDAMITAAVSTTNTTEIPFKMNGGEPVISKLKIKNMTVPAIKKVTVKDTSATILFTPNSTVKDVSGNCYYYTVDITDKITGETLELKEKGSEDAAGTYSFEKNEEDKTYSCKVTGLSGNKAYTAVITAHFAPDGKGGVMEECASKSKAKKFTTSKPLLVSEGSIGMNYISLDELRESPYSDGIRIDYEEEQGIFIENNGTYVFMAQVSNLARSLETDKLKWTISSGNKKAANIKTSASTFEMQLITAKTGTFTVTATSTVTKEAVATFKVTVVPYQSGGKGKEAQNTIPDDTVVYLPMTESGRKRKREDIA